MLWSYETESIAIQNSAKSRLLVWTSPNPILADCFGLLADLLTTKFLSCFFMNIRWNDDKKKKLAVLVFQYIRLLSQT